MGIKLLIGGEHYEATDYTVSEEATPLAASDASGSTGTISFTLAYPDPDIKVQTKALLLVEDPNNPGFMMEVT